MPHAAPAPPPRTVRPRLAAAIAVSAAVVLSAPYLGQLRAILRAAFPGHFAAIVGGAFALAVAVALGAALLRIRERRAARFAVIGLSLLAAGAYILTTSTGIPDVDAVERVHFVSYGLIAGLFYAAWRPLRDPASFLLPALAAFIVATLDEWFQWFIPNRVGEARDLLLNAAAIACGLSFAAALNPPAGFAFRLRAASRRIVAVVAAAAVVVFTAFTDVIHIGHLVAADGAGQFHSRYTHDELLALSRDRAERWRHDPPVLLVRLSREDQYLDEGLWHVRERNRRWSREDYDAARRENLILERYFEPVLDTKTYAAPALHRWPPEQRANAEQYADPRRVYVSTAEPFPIVTWSRPLFWTAASLLAALLLAWGLRPERARAAESVKA
jgi:hypothetical protein